MSEEENEAIEIVKNIEEKDLLNCWDQGEKEYKSIQILLNLYNKEKEKNKLLIEGKFREVADKNSYIKDNYISKDKVLKALGYEENDEEYKRIYNKEELILSLIRTINEECDRLEDIEDQIDNMRDNYWEDKIRKTLLKFQNEYGEDLETTDQLFIGKEVVQYGEDMIDEIAKELDIKLLEEE